MNRGKKHVSVTAEVKSGVREQEGKKGEEMRKEEKASRNSHLHSPYCQTLRLSKQPCRQNVERGVREKKIERNRRKCGNQQRERGRTDVNEENAYVCDCDVV